MEELLNKLIEKGWKPFGMECYDRFIIESNGDMCFRWKYPGADGESAFDYNYDYFKIRELVSKESGLWQFVCENNLNYSEDDSIYNVWLKHYAEDDHESPYTYASPVWYLIESSLKDESELEDFLIQNIKVDAND